MSNNKKKNVNPETEEKETKETIDVTVEEDADGNQKAVPEEPKKGFVETVKDVGGKIVSFGKKALPWVGGAAAGIVGTVIVLSQLGSDENPTVIDTTARIEDKKEEQEEKQA